MCPPHSGVDGSLAAIRVACPPVVTHLWRISSGDYSVYLPSNWPVAL